MPVDIVDWKLIGVCNLSCLHCYGPPKTERALELQKLLKLVDIFADLGTEWVVLTGGEPLLVPKIELLMHYMYDKRLKIALSTNTSLFRRFQKPIEDYVSSLNIPIDGSTPERHAMSRTDQSTYHTFFDVLRHYDENPHLKPNLLRVGSVYSRATQGDFIPIARVLEPYTDIIDTWKIYELVDYEFQPELRRHLIHQNGFESEMEDLLASTTLAPKIMVAPADSRNKAYFMVNPRGDLVVPTDMDGITYEIPVGNLLRDPLETVIEKWERNITRRNYFGNHVHYEKFSTRGYQRGFVNGRVS